MKTVRPRSLSTAPLLDAQQQAFPTCSIRQPRRAKSVTSKRSKVDDDHEEIALLEFIGSLHFDPRPAYIPADNIWRCLFDAAKKQRRRSASRRRCSFERRKPLRVPRTPGCRPAVGRREPPPALLGEVGTARITMRRRPMFRQWAVEAEAIIDTALLDVAGGPGADRRDCWPDRRRRRPAPWLRRFTAEVQEVWIVSPFNLIGERASLAHSLRDRPPDAHGPEVTYEALVAALALDPEADRHTIQLAMRRASKESEVATRALEAVPNVGYRVVKPAEHLRLAKNQQKKSHNALVRAVQGRARHLAGHGAGDSAGVRGCRAGVRHASRVHASYRHPSGGRGRHRGSVGAVIPLGGGNLGAQGTPLRAWRATSGRVRRGPVALQASRRTVGFGLKGRVGLTGPALIPHADRDARSSARRFYRRVVLVLAPHCGQRGGPRGSLQQVVEPPGQVRPRRVRRALVELLGDSAPGGRRRESAWPASAFTTAARIVPAPSRPASTPRCRSAAGDGPGPPSYAPGMLTRSTSRG